MKPNKQKIAATLAALMLSTSVLTTLTACNDNDVDKDKTPVIDVQPDSPTIEPGIIEEEIPEVIDDIDDYKDFDFEDPINKMDESFQEKIELDWSYRKTDGSYIYAITPYYDDNYKIHKAGTIGTHEEYPNLYTFAILACGEESKFNTVGENMFSSPYYSNMIKYEDGSKPGVIQTMYNKLVDEPVHIITKEEFEHVTANNHYYKYQPTEDTCILCEKCFDTTNDITLFEQYIKEENIDIKY